MKRKQDRPDSWVFEFRPDQVEIIRTALKHVMAAPSSTLAQIGYDACQNLIDEINDVTG